MSDVSRALRHPWHDLERQREATLFGVWVFIATEALFFGGLFLAYAVDRSLHAQEFARAGREASIVYGTANTAVLMTSSLTMALAVRAAEARLRRFTIAMLAATLAFGFGFLIIKAFEYADDIDRGLMPGLNFALPVASASLFWTLYWVMTGLHAAHVTGGLGIIGRLLYLTARRELPVATSPDFEATALYWHLVDIVWVLLYPLLYLVGRS